MPDPLKKTGSSAGARVPRATSRSGTRSSGSRAILGDRLDDVAALSERGLPVLDDDAGAGAECGVHLPRFGLV